MKTIKYKFNDEIQEIQSLNKDEFINFVRILNSHIYLERTLRSLKRKLEDREYLSIEAINANHKINNLKEYMMVLNKYENIYKKNVIED